MAQDVKFEKITDDVFDIPIEDGDLASVDGFETAISASIFTDARAEEGAVEESYNRRGWVGNLLTIASNFFLGSTLWLLEQARMNQDTYNSAQNKVERCLRWMLIDKIADRITVVVDQTNTREATINIDLFKNNSLIDRYSTVWRSTQPTGQQ